MATPRYLLIFRHHRDEEDEGGDRPCVRPTCAKSRTMRAKGLVNMLRISTGIMMGRSHAGSPGGTRPREEVVHHPVLADPPPLLRRNEMAARARATEMLPVAVAEKGMSPKSAATKM